ncbi:hypothetical protein H3005_19800 [Stenotrophomonas sp. Br8]|uniref:hypothetical protein n=1 Tax=Stenotrophomonas sp. Br8 TaxID=2759658 RepID=UPI00168AC589|nr:hypothetical protein [Stenotrophomonas sp. Br8]MBD3684101.1 hypothetical protein [Stenotrophomonas sp. Br8]
MTISANDRRKTYVGNGVATAFNGPRAFLSSHIQVFTGTHPVYSLVPPSQYTVTGLRANISTITFNSAPAANLDILILRTVPLDQPADITNQGAFLPEIHEDAFDYRVMQIQQLMDSSMQLVQDPDTGEFVWDAKGSRIINVGDAKLDGDAVNLRTLLALIEDIQSGGGSVGVTPKLWTFIGDGEVTDFPLAGADVLDPLFYDTAVEATVDAADYLVAKPGDYQILPGVDGSAPAIRFATPLGDGINGFTVLRGYARPWIGQPPIYTVAPRIVSVTGNTTLAGDMHNTLILANSAAPITITIRANTGSTADWKGGEFFSVMQVGAGQITLLIEGGTGQLNVPASFQAKSRSQRSIISATNIAPDADAWVAAGDLLRVASTPDLQCFGLIDRAILLSTDIAVGTSRDSIVLPYGLLLESVVSGGVYATLTTAQASGTQLTVDINRNGTSILSTKLTFDNSERSTTTAAAPAVLVAGGELLAKGDEITIDVDQVGTAGARGLRVYLVGQRAG